MPAPGAEAFPRAAARRLRTVPRSLGMLFMTSTYAACSFLLDTLYPCMHALQPDASTAPQVYAPQVTD